MNPDQQIAQDLSIGVLLFILAVTMFALLKDFGGYLPEDECANRVIESLSPYQVSQLTDSSYPFEYNEVQQWCIMNPTDWDRKRQSAKHFRELPNLLDMNL